eukprot:COSAG03_NODE_7736_length_878_cov_1.299101_1_plen_44_part_10
MCKGVQGVQLHSMASWPAGAPGHAAERKLLTPPDRKAAERGVSG